MLKKRFDKLIENTPLIQDEISQIAAYDVFPTLSDIIFIQKLCLKYIQEKNKLIYGGAALHNLLLSKNKQGIYPIPKTVNEVYDYEIYSHEPIQDMHNICDIIFNSNSRYKDIFAAEALHPTTYTIQLHKVVFMDITYVPIDLIEKIPSIEIKGFKYVLPRYTIMDIYRQFRDPYDSSYRLAKILPRMYKMLEAYPISLYETHKYSWESLEQKHIDKIKDNILVQTDLVAEIGLWACNQYMMLGGSSVIFPIRYIEVLTENMKETIIQVIKLFKSNYDIKIQEYYKLLDYVQYSVLISINSKSSTTENHTPVIRIYNKNNVCFTTTELSSNIKGGSIKKKYIKTRDILISKMNYPILNNVSNKFCPAKKKGGGNNTNKFKYRVGSFDSLMVHWMAMGWMDNKFEDVHKHLYHTQYDFFNRNNLVGTEKENNPFQIIKSKCWGKIISFSEAIALKRQQKKEKYGRARDEYRPIVKQRPAPEYKFYPSNGSENPNPRFIYLLK